MSNINGLLLAYLIRIDRAVARLAREMEIDMAEIDDDLTALTQVASDIHGGVDKVLSVVSGSPNLSDAERQQITDALQDLRGSADRLSSAGTTPTPTPTPAPAPGDPGAPATGASVADQPNQV